MSLKNNKSKSLLLLNQEVGVIIKLRWPVSVESVFAYKHLLYTWTYIQLWESKKATLKTSNIICHQNVIIYMKKFSVLLLNWNFSCLIQIYNINCLYLFRGIKRIFYCNVSRRESCGSCIVGEEIKIRSICKVVWTSFHCTWSDINTVNAGTCWQFYSNFLVRILRPKIRDILVKYT